MFLIILLIYLIILIFLEVIYILLSKNENKPYEFFNIISTKDDYDNNNNENINNNKKSSNNDMKLIESDEDVNIKNFMGKIYLENCYGFFINLNEWNFISEKKIYQFNVPIEIKILKLKMKDKIQYYIK
tara:strand:+ start:566 stop:952 length:387 start_codon:yes stop_codon:yes gene_type:complete